jgi:hypothetical protein
MNNMANVQQQQHHTSNMHNNTFELPNKIDSYRRMLMINECTYHEWMILCRASSDSFNKTQNQGTKQDKLLFFYGQKLHATEIHLIETLTDQCDQLARQCYEYSVRVKKRNNNYRTHTCLYSSFRLSRNSKHHEHPVQLANSNSQVRLYSIILGCFLFRIIRYRCVNHIKFVAIRKRGRNTFRGTIIDRCSVSTEAFTKQRTCIISIDCFRRSIRHYSLHRQEIKVAMSKFKHCHSQHHHRL